MCGDAFVILPGDELTIAVADGLGHGPAAAEAARAFCAFVAAHCREDITVILRTAVRALAGTRGAVAALLRIDERAERMKFAGVGNIELRALSRQPIHPVSVPGFLGDRPLRKVTCFDYPLCAGDLLVVHSDGVHPHFELERYGALPAQGIAEAIVANHNRDHDDATCVVVACRPAPGSPTPHA